jgi:hypothetical protein
MYRVTHRHYVATEKLAVNDQRVFLDNKQEATVPSDNANMAMVFESSLNSMWNISTGVNIRPNDVCQATRSRTASSGTQFLYNL